jgi:hypothetical protein
MMRECQGAGFITLVSERIIDLFAIKKSDINIWDIAWGLSQNNRYNGQTPVPWDVLSHTGMVFALYMADHRNDADPKVILSLLLHDAAEAYTGDLIQPIKMLPQMAWFTELDDAITETVFDACGLDWMNTDWNIIKHYDYLAVKHEIHWLKPTSNNHEFFRYIDTPVDRFMPLGKAKPWEFVELLKDPKYGINNPDLFKVPDILVPYLAEAGTAKVDEPVSLPDTPRASDLDRMTL